LDYLIYSRLHDNPALLEAIKSEDGKPVLFIPIFIFDGESAGEFLKILI
jgi:hypothetical protein